MKVTEIRIQYDRELGDTFIDLITGIATAIARFMGFTAVVTAETVDVKIPEEINHADEPEHKD